nr:Rpn family recombination-promoting nuclease/putative transposase [Colwellia sp.]
IVEVTLLNPYQVPKIEELKETILDIQATNQNNEKFIVEMQKKDLGDFAKRSLYYTSKAYVSQLKKGHDYSQLKKVYFIGLLNFEMFDNLSFISRHLIINQETTQQDIDDFEFTFIELPKFTKDLNELATTLDKWIYFIQHASDLTMIPEQYEHIKAFEDAFTIATQTQWNEDELRLYDYMGLKAYDEINALKTAVKKAVKKAEEKAEEKGLQKGAKKEKIETALKSLEQGLDIGVIKIITGLTDTELVNLTNKAQSN